MTKVFMSYKKGSIDHFYHLLHQSIDSNNDFSLYEVNLNHRLKRVSGLFVSGSIERESSEPDFAVILITDAYLGDKWLVSELYALCMLEQQKKRNFIIPVLYSNVNDEQIPIYFKENPERLIDIRNMSDEEGAKKVSSYILNISKKDERIFIGHGHSPLWILFRDFISSLGLSYDEFNRLSTAGISVSNVLSSKLQNARFAFLIMTGEDEHVDDNALHPRENVVHEAGLFQGKLGFEKAIVLLEDGCKKFSNLHGVTHIEFPRGNIRACFESVREVLKRENIIL